MGRILDQEPVETENVRAQEAYRTVANDLDKVFIERAADSLVQSDGWPPALTLEITDHAYPIFLSRCDGDEEVGDGFTVWTVTRDHTDQFVENDLLSVVDRFILKRDPAGTFTFTREFIRDPLIKDESELPPRCQKLMTEATEAHPVPYRAAERFQPVPG